MPESNLEFVIWNAQMVKLADLFEAIADRLYPDEPVRDDIPTPNSTIGPVSYAESVPEPLDANDVFSGRKGLKLWEKLKKNAKLPDGPYELLGQGTKGTAYGVDDEHVLKITSDDTEAIGAASVRDDPDPLGHAQRIYSVWEIVSESAWAIVQERLDLMEEDDPWMELSNLWPAFSRANAYPPIWPKTVTQFFSDVEDGHLTDVEAPEWSAFKKWFMELAQYFERIELSYHDFWHKNLLKRGDAYVAIDFGYSASAADPPPNIETISKFVALATRRVLARQRDEADAVDYQTPPDFDTQQRKPAHTAPAVNNPYVNEFEEAAKIAGVPESWATSHAINDLVQKESSFNPKAKSKSSSAFGLFQLLKGTWERLVQEVEHGTQDVLWQAVGGFRYIKKEYGTPEMANAFWDSTMSRVVSSALPEKLQRKAKIWIDKGYIGY